AISSERPVVSIAGISESVQHSRRFTDGSAGGQARQYLVTHALTRENPNPKTQTPGKFQPLKFKQSTSAPRSRLKLTASLELDAWDLELSRALARFSRPTTKPSPSPPLLRLL